MKKQNKLVIGFVVVLVLAIVIWKFVLTKATDSEYVGPTEPERTTKSGDTMATLLAKGYTEDEATQILNSENY